MEGRPAVRTPWRVVGLVVRVVLLSILLWGGLVSALSTFTREGTMEELRAALGDGDTVVYLPHPREVRWSDGPFGWRRLPLDDSRSVREIDRLLDAAGPPGATVVRADHDSWPPDWFEDVPARHAWLVPLAWFGTLLAMLARSRPRYANRWGWFWMFSVGGIGAPLYLLLEPQPIWAAMDGPMPPARSRLDGGSGCLVAILLAFVSGLGIAGLSGLFG
ncbi:hypothetical protein [Nonomuraea dietziae]|uniref:Uncharacterized protein n=1 Tax=Nonomuraea dietziae TaxID=65515 RepID=A0A7W5V5X3_9ACTN|nr:hypothetical protein [Nonomuraea dietziae]MBB3729719.1 hypothetical protein [Nonomuraea dietziae]